jgi:predicted MFS family arabinose efflux permease
VFALVREPSLGWGAAGVLIPLCAGLALFGAFLLWETRTPDPMLKLELFKRRNFAVANVETFAMYAGLSITFFMLSLFLQEVGGYKALDAGLALLPATIVMFLLSKRMGALADRYGPRLFMGGGPLVAALGLLGFQRVGADVDYVGDVLPAVLVFSLGLSMTVAPLTATVLADADESNAGIASGVNNAVARVAGLIGIAAAGVLSGGAGVTVAGFHQVLGVAAGLVAVGGVLGLVGIVNPRRDVPCFDCPGGALAGAPLDAAREPAVVTLAAAEAGAASR